MGAPIGNKNAAGPRGKSKKATNSGRIKRFAKAAGVASIAVAIPGGVASLAAMSVLRHFRKK